VMRVGRISGDVEVAPPGGPILARLQAAYAARVRAWIRGAR